MNEAQSSPIESRATREHTTAHRQTGEGLIRGGLGNSEDITMDFKEREPIGLCQLLRLRRHPLYLRRLLWV